MLIDTHCHLDDTSLAPRLPEVLAAARSAGVVKYIIPGVSPAGWDDITPLARREEGIFPAFGLHPMRTNLYTSRMLASLAQRLPGAVAIGEIGLDYLYADQPREKQQEAFRAQLRLAVEAGLPVLIHCRKAFRDLLVILREEDVARVGGVMHAFSGSPEIAWECIDLNLCIAVAGPVTWHNAIRPVEVVRRVPLEHLVLETDAPDLTPEPLRGQTNEPAFMVEIARKVAELKEVTAEEVARVTTANAERLFRLK
jgi:TatD DNase family protein